MTANQTKLFLSYASEDRAAAIRLRDELRFVGLDVWFDRDTLLPGQDWKRELFTAIRSADYFLVLLSHHSVSKAGVVQLEVREALDVMYERPEGSVFVIPLRLEPVSTTYKALKNIQWVDLFDDWNDSVRRLIQTFQLYSGFSPNSARLLAFNEVESEVVRAAAENEVQIDIRMAPQTVDSHVRMSKEPLRALLMHFFSNVHRHGFRSNKNESCALVSFVISDSYLIIELANQFSPHFRPSVPRTTAADTVFQQAGGSISFEVSSNGSFLAKVSLALAN